MNIKSKIAKLSKHPWFNFATGIVGFIGFVLMFVFRCQDRSERGPLFYIHKDRVPVIDSKSISNTGMRIMTHNNFLVKGDVTALRFYFWNKGKLSIRPDNILMPVVFYLEDKTCKILDVKILKSSRPKIVMPQFQLIDSTSFKFSFKILEHNDGVTGQILFTGNPEVKLNVRGEIEGANGIGNATSVLIGDIFIQFLKNIFFSILILVFGILLILAFGRLNLYLSEKIVWYRAFMRIVGTVILTVFVLLMIWLIILEFSGYGIHGERIPVPREVVL